VFVPDQRPFLGGAGGRALRKGSRFFVGLTVTVTVAGLVLAVGSVVLFQQAKAFFTAGDAGDAVAKIELAPLATRSVLYAADGSFMQTLHGEEDRLPVTLDKVPPDVVTAVLDAEDERFFEHGPIDLRAMTRALVSNLEAGSVSEGGSTITQQLVKTALLNPKKNVNRKLQEASLAIRLERSMSKKEILERYLNTVYFGNGAYGLQAAAERYYQTDVDKLTLGQGVLLAGLIRNPVFADPYNNPEDARGRRDVIIDRMVVLRHITPEQGVQLKAEPLPTPVPQVEADSTDWFTRKVVEQLLNDPKYLGGTEAERNRLVFRGGLSIHTTINPRFQAIAEQSIAETLPADRGELNAAMVSVDPATGAVRAAVSGLDFEQHKIDLLTGQGRQVGSAFKMFTLMAAMEAGDIPADTILGTSPCRIPNPGSDPDVWEAQNNEGESAGVLTLTEATVSSVNCAYARLIKLLGPQKVVDVATRMGITTSKLGADLSLTLGTSDVTPLEMASAYATLAADGEHHDPYLIESIDDHNGKSLYKNTVKTDRAVTVQNARTVTSVLQQVVQRGTGTAAVVKGWQVAGKTGSTDNNTDAWFVGATPKLTTAVWMGSPAGKVPMYNVGIFPKVFGGTYPAMIFGDYMNKALADVPPVNFGVPDRVPNQRPPKYLALDKEAPPSFDGGSTRQSTSSGSGRSTAPVDNTPSREPSSPVVTAPSVSVPSVPQVPAPVVTTPPRVTVPPEVGQFTIPTTPRRPRDTVPSP
jgi:penicillin-binding protein 1A